MHEQAATLIARDLWKSYRKPDGAEFEVLRGLTFEAAPGAMLAIMGASGAGKSTLLHLLGGLDAPQRGAIRFGAFEITGATRRTLVQFRQREASLIFQAHHLLPDLTAVENVALPLLINRQPRRASLLRATTELDRLGLKAQALQPVGQLSGGEQQRVALARALVREPQLVLADEPTGNLDADTGAQIGAELLNFCRRRQAVVIIATHNQHLAQLCDRTLRLQEGQLN